MYLKNIEIQGFKSFANKIVFEFHNGITGIVGPNGSGKSNVADAVRWVLGEQKVKQLRGANMQDVIFAGTENRKPVGYAFVAITLDNTDHKLAVDYEEVTVARRIYRSGESEYLINGTPCRLKDINELFYDTGIGKEGYSIIGQGQIDKILSGKPEERRELFDEAAGIVKFKRRKNTAQKKLEDERQNLLRINDILSELEKQIEPLKLQSETAREYLKKKEELKIYDINMFLLGTAHTKEQLKSVEEKYNTAVEDLDKINLEYEEAKVKYDEIADTIDEADEEINQLKAKLNESTLLKKQLENQIEVLKEQINTDKLNDEHLRKRTTTIEEELKTREQQKEELDKKNQDIAVQLEETAVEDKSAKEELAKVQTYISELNEQIEKEKSEIINLLNDQMNTKTRQQRYDTMLEQVNLRKTELNQKLLQIKSDESEQDELLSGYSQELQEVNDQISELSKDNDAYETEIEALQKEIAKQNEQLNIGRTAFHREQSRLESLKNLTERYDGYGNSIRRVMEKKNQNPGLIGVVADIVKTKKEYELAIETALGGSIQNIVTDSEDTAKQMIAYLKQNKYGRATFLPLTSVKKRQEFRNKNALQEPGVVGLASELVHTEKQYEELAEYLLGRTVVAKTIDHAIALQRKYQYSLRIVTVEGESLNPGGSMTGGAFKNSSNLLGRRREIQEFEESVKLLEKELNETQEQIEDSKRKRSDLYRKMDEIKDMIQEQMLLKNMSEMNISQTKLKKKELAASYDELFSESGQIKEQASEINGKISEINQESSQFDEKKAGIEGEVERISKILEGEKEKESKALQNSEKIHLKFANLRQEHSFISQNLERIEEEILTRLEEQESLKENISETAGNILKKEEDIKKLKETVASSGDVFIEIEEEITKAKKRKDALSDDYKELFKRREELSEQRTSLDKETYRLSSQKEKLEETEEQQINYMWEEYELTYNAALELRDESYTDMNAMKKSIAGLKDEIRKLGDVNVNAIEDYKNLSERYEFLSTQRDDLIQAEETLLKIIEELDTGMKNQFREKFHEIAAEFDKVFKQLFGGGKGSLELLDEEDLLETGITIVAQPPGKKLQNMMQLSGGEKALTAIALLFAIQNLKPSPFCLLDEIEAALDDSNVTRYAKYLHKLTKNTQFIVITHRRGTMAAADRLYGITMQEKGVSALVSVNLIEDSLDE